MKNLLKRLFIGVPPQPPPTIDAPNVVQLHKPALTDIPAQLRQLADELEAGGEVESLVCLTLGSKLRLYGWGRADAGQSALMLHAALSMLSSDL